MQHYPRSIRSLIRNLSKLPGIGEKTAERLAIHILRKPMQDAHALAESIVEMKQTIKLCSLCYALSDAERCQICADASRDASKLCVVEQPADMVSIEKSGAFKGLYHILGGVLSPMEGIGPQDLRLNALFQRIEKGGVAEVILATGTSVEGESTAAYIAQQLARFAVKATRIASGVPIGGDLKYVDQMTMRCALEGRHDV